MDEVVPAWEVLDMEVGHIAADMFDDGLRVLIMRGPVALCCYVGVPLAHPLAGHSYDDLSIECHGGLTYSNSGGDRWPEGFWWYGWDYAHAGDRCVYAYREPLLSRFPLRADEKEWTVEDVKKDIWDALYGFKKHMRLAEAIAQKALGWKEKLQP